MPSPFTRFTIPPTDRSLAMLLSLAQLASDFRTRLQTAVDPFTDRIVCRVTKISPVRVASGLQSTRKTVSSQCGLDKTSRGDPGS